MLPGCFNQSLNVADRQVLKTIRITPPYIAHPLYYYTGKKKQKLSEEIGSAVGEVLGKGLADLAFGKNTGAYTPNVIGSQDSDYEPNDEEAAKKLETFLDKNNIAIDKIVFDELNDALRKAGKIPVTEIADQTTTILKIKVFEHGFYVLNGFSGDVVVPLLSVWCKLIDSNGKQIWADHHNIEVAGSPVKAVPLKEFTENAKAIENLWRSAAKIAIENILVELYPVK